MKQVNQTNKGAVTPRICRPCGGAIIEGVTRITFGKSGGLVHKECKDA